MIPIKNIYYMLSYAFSILREEKFKKVEIEEFDNIFEMLASIISKATSSLIKRGLGKNYISRIEETSLPHGKIDIAGSIKSNLINKHKLICEYDDYLPDTYLNQIIKLTMMLLIKQEINLKLKKELKVLLMYFKDVSIINYYSINWNITYNKNNQHYELLIGLSYLVLKGMLQTQSDGSIKLMNFIDEQRMSKLYEKFILEFYKKECSWMKVTSSKINWQLDNEDCDNLPSMQSDIMIENNNKILIIDAKYYSNNMQEYFDKKSIISTNLYQIFTYVKNKQYEDSSKEVLGMLLYAKTNSEIQPDNFYIMSGNKLFIKTLDLSSEFKNIKSMLLSYIEPLNN